MHSAQKALVRSAMERAARSIRQWASISAGVIRSNPGDVGSPIGEQVGAWISGPRRPSPTKYSVSGLTRYSSWSPGRRAHRSSPLPASCWTPNVVVYEPALGSSRVEVVRHDTQSGEVRNADCHLWIHHAGLRGSSRPSSYYTSGQEGAARDWRARRSERYRMLVGARDRRFRMRLRFREHCRYRMRRTSGRWSR